PDVTKRRTARSKRLRWIAIRPPSRGLGLTHFNASTENAKNRRGGAPQALAPLSAGGGRGSRVDEGCDLVAGKTYLAQDLDAVLAQPRGQPADGAGGLAVHGGDAGKPHRPLGRVLDDLPEPDGVQMRIVE